MANKRTWCLNVLYRHNNNGMFQAAVTSISVLYANINDVRMAVAFTQDYSSQWHMLNYLVGVIE